MTERPDVVVTALGVPSEADGLQLIRSLRSHGATTEVPIIVVSGRVFAIEQQRAFEAGCDVFLPKPLLPDALAQEVRRTVAAKRRGTFKADEAQ
jgi:CheY-like chemotaxis protein